MAVFVFFWSLFICIRARVARWRPSKSFTTMPRVCCSNAAGVVTQRLLKRLRSLSLVQSLQPNSTRTVSCAVLVGMTASRSYMLQCPGAPSRGYWARRGKGSASPSRGWAISGRRCCMRRLSSAGSRTGGCTGIVMALTLYPRDYSLLPNKALSSLMKMEFAFAQISEMVYGLHGSRIRARHLTIGENFPLWLSALVTYVHFLPWRVPLS